MSEALRKRNAGLMAFFFSGICVISTGVVVSILQEQYGLAYGVTGTLISVMHIGNLVAGFAAGVLPARIGFRNSVVLLAAGYAVGYAVMGLSGLVPLLAAAFLLVGIAKGVTLNTCTILVGDNSPNRTTGMNLMHACYALGALLCPFVIAAAQKSGLAPTWVLAMCGVVLWLVFFASPFGGRAARQSRPKADWGFLRSRRFWLLTGLIFCQNAAENGVNSWMVTYYKGSGIISGTMSPYTVTVMWSATLVARLLIAFVLPLKKPVRAMLGMSLGCIVFYGAMMRAHTQTAAMLTLLCFAFSMAGMNPTAVSLAGKMTSVTSMGVMLPVASGGAILMPWIIGQVAERVGIGAGMAANVVPCVGLLVFSALVLRLPRETA